MNEYGLSVGGPIWRDKIFLFANYMGYRFDTLTTPAYQSVPTARMRTGDFGELLSLATPVKIYDPITQACASSSVCTRTAYTNNVIPTTELSPIALKMASMLPAPTTSGLTNNYLGSYAWGLNNWSQSERLDVDLNSKQKLAVIVGAGRQGLIGSAGSQTTNVAPLPYEYAKSYRPVTKDVMIEHTYILSDTLVNQFKYAALQYKGPSINPTYGVSNWSATSFGIGGLPSTGQASNSFPQVSFGSADEANWGPQSSSLAVTNNFTLLDNMQWIHGKNAFSFGGQFQWLGYNYSATGYQPSLEGSSPLALKTAVTETAAFKSKSTSVASGSGFDYASFMLGAFDSGSYTTYAPLAQETGTRFHPYAMFINDDYKASDKLTVNMGLRWDIFTPMKEAENRLSFLDPNATNPYSGTPGALGFAEKGYGRTPIKEYMKNFGPRLGFAYQVDNKTVVRASVGMYYALGGGVGGTANSTQPGSALELGYSAAPSPSSPGYALPVFYLNGNSALTKTTLPGNVVNDPTNTSFGGAGYTVVAPPNYDAGYATAYSTNASSTDLIASTLGYLDPKYGGRAPEFTGWSFGFQRSITKDMTATLSYVGNEGHFLVANNGSSTERGYYNNQLDPKYLALGTALGTKVSATNLGSLGLSLPFSTFNTGQNLSQMLTPFPQYKGVTDEVAATSNSVYNSLQLSINQRLSRGLTFMLNYTFSKSIDNAGTFRTGYAIPSGAMANNAGSTWELGKVDRSLSSFDQRQNVTGTATYDLPFGAGHLGGDNLIVRSIVGGWRISGIGTYVEGNPLALTSSTCTGVVGQGQCMPAYNINYTGKSARANGGWGKGDTRDNMSVQYIDPTAFVQTGSLANPYVLGDVARTAPFGLRGPSNTNFDASVRRTFDLWTKENVKFVFEANAFNVANHVWFGSTSSNATGSINQAVGTAALGTVAGQANNPRQFQFAGHVNF
jgi:hypothetical protein